MLTNGKPRARGRVQSDLLSATAKRRRTQVTYAGHPLYFYAHEGKYQVLCHNIKKTEAPGSSSSPMEPAPR